MDYKIIKAYNSIKYPPPQTLHRVDCVRHTLHIAGGSQAKRAIQKNESEIEDDGVALHRAIMLLHSDRMSCVSQPGREPVSQKHRLADRLSQCQGLLPHKNWQQHC